MIYRNEKKFVVDENFFTIMSSKLDPLMNRDRHGDHGTYRIRSMYFDTYERRSYRENDAGIEERKKYRIRVYDDPKASIRLEIKHKLKNRNYKRNCIITEEQFNDILSNNLVFNPTSPQALQMLYLDTNLNLLRPSIIVEYSRTAYVYDAGNVRITFDRNISYSYAFDRFLEKDIPLIPLLGKNKHVFEVKYNGVLPGFIAQTIETGELSRRTFSKFYFCHLNSEGEGFECWNN